MALDVNEKKNNSQQDLILNDESIESFLVKQPLRFILLICGCLAVAFGVLGIFLPLLPTVPFLLLAAACFSRSSRKLQLWLFNNKYLGHYLHNYLVRKGITEKQLRRSLISMWGAMLIAIYFAPLILVKVLLVIIAICVSRHLIMLERL